MHLFQKSYVIQNSALVKDYIVFEFQIKQTLIEKVFFYTFIFLKR